MNPNQRVKMIRKKIGLNQVDFSKALEITQSYLSEIENAKDKRGKPLSVSEEVRRKLWEVFKVNITWLMAGGDDSEMFLSEKTNSMYQAIQHPSNARITQLSEELEKRTAERDQLKEDISYYKEIIMNLSKGKEFNKE